LEQFENELKFYRAATKFYCRRFFIQFFTTEKLCLFGYRAESTDIEHYANSDKTFSNQSASDQSYDEKQFGAYRASDFSQWRKLQKNNSRLFKVN